MILISYCLVLDISWLFGWARSSTDWLSTNIIYIYQSSGNIPWGRGHFHTKCTTYDRMDRVFYISDYWCLTGMFSAKIDLSMICYLLSNEFISNFYWWLSRLFMDKFQTTLETCWSQLRNIDNLDHLDLTIACFYLSQILTWFTMEGKLLVMQPPPNLWNNISGEIYKTDTKSV